MVINLMELGIKFLLLIKKVCIIEGIAAKDSKNIFQNDLSIFTMEKNDIFLSGVYKNNLFLFLIGLIIFTKQYLDFFPIFMIVCWVFYVRIIGLTLNEGNFVIPI